MKRFFAIGLILFVALTACTGNRVPRPKTAQAAATRFFKRYGRKYENTRFAESSVGRVSIYDSQEINKNTAYTQAVVEFKDGHAALTLLKLERHFPTGWKITSWEILQEK